MFRKISILLIVIFLCPFLADGQIKIRLFASQTPETVVFAVTNGEYELNAYSAGPQVFHKNELIAISEYNGRLAVKPYKSAGFITDSLVLTSRSEESSFYLRTNGENPIRQYYNGDFFCYPDMETLVLINKSDIEV